MPEIQPILQTIQGERFGAEGTLHIIDFEFHIPTDTVGEVTHRAHVVRRSDNPIFSDGARKNESVSEGPKQIVLMSGFATEAMGDWGSEVFELFSDMHSLEQI